MKTKFGYVLQKGSGVDRNGYAHLYLTIFSYQAEWQSWSSIIEISWQSDINNNYWYGFRLTFAPVLTASYFPVGLKFLNRINKAGNFGSEPEEFVNWLQSLPNVEQIAFDNRVAKYVTVKELSKTQYKVAFRVIAKNNSLVDIILADDETQAQEIAGDNTVSLYSNAYFDKPHSLLEWLKLPF